MEPHETDAEVWSAIAILGKDDGIRGLEWGDMLNLLNSASTQVVQDLKAEREKVRVLRDALENLVDRDLIKGDPYLDDYFEEVGDALAATVDPEKED